MTDAFDPTKDPASTDADAVKDPPAADPDPTTRVEMSTPPSTPLTPASRDDLPPSTFEHESEWATSAPATRVVPDRSGAPRRSGRVRWAIGLGVLALVIVTSAAVALLITGRSADATVLGYVPAGSTMYGEVRMDLPGDQRRAIGEFLTKFPGFADQASLETKLDEVLDDLVKQATKQEQTYTHDIKPWFGGELAFSLGALPPAASLSNNDPSAMAGFRALALVSVKDPIAAQAWFDAAVTKSGAKTTKETYDGVSLTVFDTVGGVQPAFAVVDGKVVVVGDIASVKSAVDTKGAGAFSKEPGPKAALAASTGDHVGYMYVAIRPFMDWSKQLSGLQATQSGGTAMVLGDSFSKAIPEWGAFALRFQSDAIVMESTAPRAETSLGPTENRASTVLEHVPSSAIVASIANDYGKTIKQAIDLYRSEPSFKPIFDQLDKGLGLVGGEDAAIGWAGDTAIVITVADETPEGGLIVKPTDKTAADHLFTSLRSFIAIGGAQQGITLRDETYNGTTITIVDLGDLSKLSGASGVDAGGAFPGLKGHAEIAYAVTDQIVVLGSGPGFVKHVLDTTKDTSLASNERYTKLADRAGKGVGTSFVDITAIRSMVEKFITDSGASPASMAKYETDIKPFLVPFDALFLSGTGGNDINHSSIYLTVK